MNLRFLDAALNQLVPLQTDAMTLATEGNYLLYSPEHILRRYKGEAAAVVRDYLHVIFHCVFRHMYVAPTIYRPCWDLACDVAVEYTISGLDVKAVQTASDAAEQEEFARLKSAVGKMTAEKLYRYFMDRKMSDAEIARVRALFCADDHAVWYMDEQERAEAGVPSASAQQPSRGQSQKSKSSGNKTDGDGEQSSGGSGSGDDEQESGGEDSTPSTGRERWEEISNRMQMEMENFAKTVGKDPGGLMQNLREINRERYDYTAFLKKFAVMGEVMRVNDDEFDQVFYTYGLSLYKNMPLIEPLEYKETKRIREFVVAIDTSGSVMGDAVQTFLQKTYNILKSTESFFSKINLHIIQCDADIQEDKKITTQEEFDKYIKTMSLRGFGGTDFRPVFSYVDELIAKHEFTNLKGLIYFTDGYGVFPAHPPDYDAAFVFIDDEDNNYDVPAWAIKLVLRRDEI